MRVHQIFISPGHNYFGHHGRAPGGHAMIECGEVQCVAGRGIVGDRFFDFKPNYSGQITFFSRDLYERLCRELQITGKPASVFRRNVLVSGADLNSLIGAEFEIGGVRFRGNSECTPCYWMDHAFGPGAEAMMKGQGGLRAAILTDGILRKDGP